MPVNDPQVLTVKQVPGAPAAQMDYNFFYRTVDRNGNPLEKPATLCGISFFAELGGHDPTNAEGIELWSSQDTTRPPAYRCPAAGRPHPVGSIVKYRLTYEAHLNALYHNGLCAPPSPPRPAHFNYVRLFLGHESGQDVHAFQRAPNGKFNLHVVDEDFMNRLREFVEKARARGVVVCISLTSIQAIKPAGWVVGPFYYKNNNNGLERFSDGRGTFCNTTPVPTPAVVASKVQAAIDRYRGKGYALLFDADAAYWAQRSPTRYVTAVFGRNGSFNYRWPGPMLREVVNPNAPPPPGGDYCKEVNGNFGLDQRLGLIRAGVGFDAKVTPFPLPAADVPKNLAAAFEAGAIKLTFGRPAAPANPKDPDTKPEGYVVFFGATAATVGQGVGSLRPRRYFQVANPESPQLTIPFTPTAGMRNVYVAVAAYNGPLVGERSNVARVALPAG